MSTLEFLRSLIANQASSPITDTTFHGWGKDHSAFIAGKLGMYDQWMSGSTTVMSAAKSGAMTQEWSVVASPLSPAGKRAADIGSAIVCIGANTQNGALVYDFLKYHLSNVESLLANEYLTSLPTMRKVLQHPQVQKRLPVPRPEVIMNALNHPAFRIIWGQQEEFWRIVDAQLNKFWKGEASLEQAVNESTRLAQALLESSRGK